MSSKDKIEQAARVLFESDEHPMLDRLYHDMGIPLDWTTLNYRNKERYRAKARQVIKELGYEING